MRFRNPPLTTSSLRFAGRSPWGRSSYNFIDCWSAVLPFTCPDTLGLESGACRSIKLRAINGTDQSNFFAFSTLTLQSLSSWILNNRTVTVTRLFRISSATLRSAASHRPTNRTNVSTAIEPMIYGG
jgi:hypothetical protein